MHDIYIYDFFGDGFLLIFICISINFVLIQYCQVVVTDEIEFWNSGILATSKDVSQKVEGIEGYTKYN